MDGFLCLKGGAYFLGNRMRGSEIFMRDCYVSMLDRIMELWRGNLCRFIITGIGSVRRSVEIKTVM